MTGKELFTRTLKCEPVGGQVPTFELTFFLTMEAFSKLYPGHRSFGQWDQMSAAEQKLHIDDIAGTYILSPAHTIQYDVPAQDLPALCRGAQEDYTVWQKR